MKDINKKKKNRTYINKEASKELLQAFKKDPFPSAKKRAFLANKTTIPIRSVQIWFQNQRQKNKLSYKNHLENLTQKKKEVPENLLLKALTEVACMELDKNANNKKLE